MTARIIIASMLLAALAHAQSFTDIASPQYYGKTKLAKAYAAIDANFAQIESGSDVSYGALTVTESITAISTNGATTNVVVTVDGELDGETVADDSIDEDSIDFGTGADQVSASDMPDEDLGDVSVSSGAWTIDADVVDAANIGTIVQSDTNAVPTTTDYTPAFVGQVLIGSASNQVWIAKDVTTNGWVQVSN